MTVPRLPYGDPNASPINEPPLLSAVCEETRVQESQTASHTTSQRQSQIPFQSWWPPGPCPAVSALGEVSRGPPEDTQRTHSDRVCKPESLTGCKPGHPGAGADGTRRERVSEHTGCRGGGHAGNWSGRRLRPLPSRPVRSQSSRPQRSPQVWGQTPRRGAEATAGISLQAVETFPASPALPGGPRIPSPHPRGTGRPRALSCGHTALPPVPPGTCGVWAISSRGRGAEAACGLKGGS